MEKKETNIEKILFPESNTLIDNYRMQLIDAELDPVDCKFHGDDCVKIDTEQLQWVTLTIENLYMLIDAIEEVQNN